MNVSTYNFHGLPLLVIISFNFLTKAFLTDANSKPKSNPCSVFTVSDDDMADDELGFISLPAFLIIS